MRLPTSRRISPASCSAFALTIALGIPLLGQSAAQQPKATVSDAQVEANVLKTLAGAPDLANQPITTTTVYGVVTLSGSVPSEAQRTEAENLAARTIGVQKVVDQLTLGTDPGAEQQASTGDGGSAVADAQGTNPNLRSDGTVAPPDDAQQSAAPDQQGQPDSQSANQPPDMANCPSYGPGPPAYR